jgi:predicted ATPase
VIDHLQRLLQFRREDSPLEKLAKLEQALQDYRLPVQEVVPLFAALLSLPHPEGYPPLTLSPAKQKQKTQEALSAWLLAEAERKPVLAAWEDLHWADPSTLELHGLLLDQAPTARMLTLLTFRPEFSPPWGARAHVTPLTLHRLGRTQVEAMVAELTSGKALPTEVVRQIVAKTDGMPLFVEELTKMVIEAVGATGRSPLQLAIPTTLHDALMARLDRLAPVREVAQLAATLGREFSYELLQSVSPLDEVSLPQALAKLVEAEVLYQLGLPPQATYLFKHALIQDAAYQSLLKSKRQQYHSQIAQVLEERFVETKEAQPELLAHHYTEASLIEQALPHWQRAGERAAQRSAYVEAIAHLTRGLEVLKALPDTPERAQHELTLQLTLCDALVAVKGFAAPDVEKVVTRARALCQQLGETPQLVPVLWRLWAFYFNRGEVRTAHELSEQLVRLAQSVQDRFLLSVAHKALGWILHMLGESASARPHLEQAIALYDPQTHPHSIVDTADPRVDCLSFASLILLALGYPDQALKKSHEVVALAEGLAHPFSLAIALGLAAFFHLLRREEQLARERAEAVITLATEQGFPYWLAVGTMVRGWMLVEQGQVEEGIAQIQQSLAAFRAIGAEFTGTVLLPMLAEAYGKVGQVEEGLAVLAEVLALVDKTGIRWCEVELYRLKGTLTLQSKVPSPKSQVEAEAEACFLKAIEVARRQSAKSLELRAVVSLSRLWQKQGRKEEARKILAEIYHWFTEGFDTKDLQEAQGLLEELHR